MESLGAVVMKKRMEEGKVGPLDSFVIKLKRMKMVQIIEKPECTNGTVAVRDDVTGIWAAYELGN